MSAKPDRNLQPAAMYYKISLYKRKGPETKKYYNNLIFK
jgi:hypothetical protein